MFDKILTFILFTLGVAILVLSITMASVVFQHFNQKDTSLPPPSPPTLEVLEDKQRGVVCYKLDWSDSLSCLPSQWLYEVGEMK